MNFMRSVLWAGAALAFCGVVNAQAVEGGGPPPASPPEAAPVVAPPPPPPPPPPASSSAGLVASISFDELKAVFDAAGVPYELKASGSGYPYISAAPDGFRFFASVSDCPDPSKLVGCGAVSLESGIWDRKTTVEEANYFNSNYVTAKVFLSPEGSPGLIYTFRISAGVSASFVRSELKAFVGIMKYFGSMTWLPAASPTPTPATGGSFSTGFRSGGPEFSAAGAETPRQDGVPAR